MTIHVEHRFRRLRQSPAIRDLVRQTQLSTDDLVLPIFVEEGIDEAMELSTMPGVYRHPESAIG